MFKFHVSMLLHLILLVHVVFMRAELARERMHLMTGHILNLNHSRCSEMIKPPYYETCELHDLKDNKAIGNECVSEKQRCADGSYNKTCIILRIDPDGRQSYTCRCHDNRKPKLPTVEYHWSRWNRVTDSRVGLYWEMKDVLDTDPQHDQPLAKEYRLVLWTH